MALRASMSYLKPLISRLSGTSNLSTMSLISPTMTSSFAQDKGITTRLIKGDIVPLCMAVGMIGTSVSLGIFTAKQQLRHSPNVHVKKSRRETIPEVVDPEHVVEEADYFINKSFFRKIAHIRDKIIPNQPVNPDSANLLFRQRRAVTLKEIGVDPVAGN